MKRFLAVLCMLVLATVAGRAEETKAAADVKSGDKPKIQMAILLDTSNSMDGLIDQARSHIWKIVNEFITCTRDGKKPDLEVALYEYGNTGIPAGQGHVRMVLPLTNDFDKVSEELFKLKTSGGNEYCGWVIKAATEGLAWSKSNSDLKVIFIAGNESFTQGTVNYADACKAAISRGIIVNTIHCGSESEGVGGKWQDGAALADGKFINIDQNQQVVHIDAPQDTEIARLGSEINRTYIAYGKNGKDGADKQTQQDENAKSAQAGSFGSRASCKASSNYRNDHWDLVDACSNDNKKLQTLKDEDLPEALRALSMEERTKHVAEKAAEREVIQKKILTLTQERESFVAQELKKRAGSGKESLDSAARKAAREQAEKKNFQF